MVRYPAKIQKEVNDWARNFADPMFKIDWGTIKLSKGNTYSHNLRVCEVALVLLDNDIPFATEVRLIMRGSTRHCMSNTCSLNN